MDPVLKQRLVGAIVLVALAVIVIPSFLDQGSPRIPVARPRDMAPMPPDPVAAGPLPLEPEVVTEIDSGLEAAPDVLAERAANVAGPVQEIVTEPANPAGPAKPEAPVTEHASQTARIAPRSVAAAPPTPTKASPSGHGGWVVQLGSFGSSANADKLADHIKAAGFAGFVAPLAAGGKQAYRVWVGPVTDRAAAARLQAQIAQRLGYHGLIVQQD